MALQIGSQIPEICDRVEWPPFAVLRGEGMGLDVTLQQNRGFMTLAGELPLADNRDRYREAFRVNNLFVCEDDSEVLFARRGYPLRVKLKVTGNTIIIPPPPDDGLSCDVRVVMGIRVFEQGLFAACPAVIDEITPIQAACPALVAGVGQTAIWPRGTRTFSLTPTAPPFFGSAPRIGAVQFRITERLFDGDCGVIEMDISITSPDCPGQMYCLSPPRRTYCCGPTICTPFYACSAFRPSTCYHFPVQTCAHTGGLAYWWIITLAIWLYVA